MTALFWRNGNNNAGERGNVIGIVSAKLSASAALAANGSLPENVNYAVKGSLLLSFLKSVPDVSVRLKAPKSLQTAKRAITGEEHRRIVA